MNIEDRVKENSGQINEIIPSDKEDRVDKIFNFAIETPLGLGSFYASYAMAQTAIECYKMDYSVGSIFVAGYSLLWLGAGVLCTGLGIGSGLCVLDDIIKSRKPAKKVGL